MRPFLIITSLATLLAIGAEATTVPGSINGGRFGLRTTPSKTSNLTAAERYAWELTHRTPTRRSTAQRRQESAESIPTEMSFMATSSNADTGSPLGNVVISSDGFVVNGEDIGNSLSTEYNPTWASRSQLRVRSSSLAGYPNLGLVQFSATSGITLGAGLSNGVRVTGVADPGSDAGSIPVYLSSYGSSSANLAVETDVWTIDATVQRITVQWVNPDGSTPTTYLITNGVDLAATGDVAAFNAQFGPGWFTTTLSYSTTSS